MKRKVILSFFLEATRLKEAYEGFRYNPGSPEANGASILLGSSMYIAGLDFVDGEVKVVDTTNDPKRAKVLNHALNHSGRGFYTLEDMMLLLNNEQSALLEDAITEEQYQQLSDDENADLGAKILFKGIDANYKTLKQIFSNKGIEIDEDIELVELNKDDLLRIRQERMKSSRSAMSQMLKEMSGMDTDVLETDDWAEVEETSVESTNTPTDGAAEGPDIPIE